MNPPLTRRTMAEALQPPKLSPEAIALIKQGTPKPQTDTTLIVAPKPRDVSTPTPTHDPAPPTKFRAKKDQPTPSSQLASVYIRLPVELSQALLKASLERKLNRIQPFTQQDIMAEALQLWLQKNGFDPKRG